MSALLCITFRFIQPFPLFHGRGDGGAPEWPPSPMRAFQALVNATSLQYNGQPLPDAVESALLAIENVRPSIVAPEAQQSSVGYRTYVPHNQADLVTAAWDRGDLTASIASHRGEKDVRPMRIAVAEETIPTLYYIYPLDAAFAECEQVLNALRPCVRSICALGWGIDQVVADASLITESQARALPGRHWQPVSGGQHLLRVHRNGSLHALRQRHERFLARIVDGTFTPVPPVTALDVVRYACEGDPLPRPHAVFMLLDDNNDTYRHPHSRFIHIAGMVRHLAIDTMTRNPPSSVGSPALWIERYVAGHRDAVDQAATLPHEQLSYLPLPSIGNYHTDPGVRRIMISAPVGDDVILEQICRHLDGLQLEPEKPYQLPRPVFLHRVYKDKVADCYTRASTNWASFTPVVLPGHDDRRPNKTRKLIEKALIQSGIDQPCEYEWSAFSYFGNKSYSAHKYDRSKRTIGFLRPSYLLSNTAVHLRIRFGRREDPKDRNSRWIPAPRPGPIAIGPGRHCGFGLMAAVDDW